jgi:cell wall assembly regulator SMI1
MIRDDSYRFPQHRWPDPQRPAVRPNDGRPTDPAVLAEIGALVDEFGARHRAANGEWPRWDAGYSEEQIAAAETRIGLRLPEDLRAFYRLIHDDGYETGVTGRFGPAPLEQVVEWHAEVDEHTFNGDTSVFADEPLVFDLAPAGRVRRTSGNDRWVPFATDHAMNFGVVDLDPAPGGAYGQIFAYGRDSPEYLAPSLADLMRAALTGADLEEPPDPEWRVSVGDRSLPELVAELPAAGDVQNAYFVNVAELSLGDLAGLPALRSVGVGAYPAKPGHVDLTPPAGAPVELVDVTAASFEPGRLAGAPHLAYLTLAGNREPVRIADLAKVPGLLRLNLAGAAVADVPAIAAFPALRVLILDGDQWEALLASGWDPRGLAAAEIAGRRTEAQTAAFHRTMTA